MFNLGPLEIVAIFIVALLVFGPEKLPEIGRQVGRGVKEFRKIQNSLQDGMREAIDPLTEAIRDNPITETLRDNPITQTLRDNPITEAMNAAPTPPSAPKGEAASPEVALGSYVQPEPPPASGDPAVGAVAAANGANRASGPASSTPSAEPGSPAPTPPPASPPDPDAG